MDKFTQKIGKKIDVRKYNDKTKNDIYSIIKENISILIDGNSSYDHNSDISLEGLDELTNVLYDYIQQEKAKQEVLTLEKIKLNAALGRSFDIKEVNEHIESLNEKYKI